MSSSTGPGITVHAAHAIHGPNLVRGMPPPLWYDASKPNHPAWIRVQQLTCGSLKNDARREAAKDLTVASIRIFYLILSVLFLFPNSRWIGVLEIGANPKKNPSAPKNGSSRPLSSPTNDQHLTSAVKTTSTEFGTGGPVDLVTTGHADAGRLRLQVGHGPVTSPKHSMSVIFTYIGVVSWVNVGIYGSLMECRSTRHSSVTRTGDLPTGSTTLSPPTDVG